MEVARKSQFQTQEQFGEQHVTKFLADNFFLLWVAAAEIKSRFHTEDHILSWNLKTLITL